MHTLSHVCPRCGCPCLCMCDVSTCVSVFSSCVCVCAKIYPWVSLFECCFIRACLLLSVWLRGAFFLHLSVFLWGCLLLSTYCAFCSWAWLCVIIFLENNGRPFDRPTDAMLVVLCVCVCVCDNWETPWLLPVSYQLNLYRSPQAYFLFLFIHLFFPWMKRSSGRSLHANNARILSFYISLVYHSLREDSWLFKKIFRYQVV